MSARLIATIGLPGSGKTTWARAQVAAGKAHARVARDDLRRMLFRPDYSEPDIRLELIVNAAEDALIGALLDGGLRVIEDATNLHPSSIHRLRSIAHRSGARFETKDFTFVPLADCVARDAQRTGVERVGREVIERMHAQWIAPEGGDAA